ncbi:MAG: OmpA family protein [Phyllobacterium sp.]
MRRTALFLASTTFLLSAQSALTDQLGSPSDTPAIVAQEAGATPEADQEQLLKREAEQAQRKAEEDAARQAEEAQRGAEEAKRQADEAARAQEAETVQRAEEAKKAAAEEAERQREAQKAAQEEAKRQADEAHQAGEEEAARQIEEAKKAAAEEAAAAEKAQKEAAEQAKQQADEARNAAEEDTAKQAEKNKNAAAEEAEKAAQEAEAARKAAEDASQTQGEAEKEAAEQAAREAEAEASRKAMEAEAAKKAAEGAADAQTTQPPVEDVTPSDQQQPPAAEPAPASPNAQPPAETTETAPTPAQDPQKPGPETAQPATPLPENVAPVLDSAKEPAPAPAPTGSPAGSNEAAGQPLTPAPVAQPATPPAPPPATDAEAQLQREPVKIESIRLEEGTRIQREPRRERRRDVEVVREIEDRTIVEINNNIFVESPDRSRLSRDAEDVYYENLPRGRVRETIVRPNGVQVVTIRNRYGDVIQRSRVLPDGREVVLNYATDFDNEDDQDWRDPGLDLPPMHLTIPVNDYILDAEELPEDRIYEFLARPPVERVERIYSLDEVRRSARIRDKVRRIDLDTITFGFGSSDIAENQIARMENVADAMLEVLEKNPAETFLIEGHTDAVGRDQSNLVLSDRRAEAVAVALTNVFGIPPENMATQGYGERYLKIKSDKPEQQNRRVAIRRITSLVAPVASR